MKIKRRKTRTVTIGSVKIGSAHPIAIQSMCKVPTHKPEEVCRQIANLKKAGCDIVRLAIENTQDIQALKTIRRSTDMPLVADIHFDYRLALLSIEAGVDKVRLNPGNIFSSQEVREVIAAARHHRIPIRIGANSGSVRTKGKDAVSSLVTDVRQYLKIFKKEGFHDLVISLKASSILETVEATRRIARYCDYPLHLGVTATGLPQDGVVKSSLGIGVLLFGGIGDTIRASILGSPVQEVRIARLLLTSLGLRQFGPQIICCPTCGRCEVDLLKKAKALEEFFLKLDPQELAHLKKHKIALMGCVVNGPGEAKEATMGIAFSKRKGAFFRNGKIVQSVSLDKAEELLFDVVRQELACRKWKRR